MHDNLVSSQQDHTLHKHTHTHTHTPPSHTRTHTHTHTPLSHTHTHTHRSHTHTHTHTMSAWSYSHIPLRHARTHTHTHTPLRHTHTHTPLSETHTLTHCGSLAFQGQTVGTQSGKREVRHRSCGEQNLGLLYKLKGEKGRGRKKVTQKSSPVWPLASGAPSGSSWGKGEIESDYSSSVI